ncbi:activating transcription factor 7-interacting protein 1 [Galendromus occidentalis]|uniref:Activating transcription factor 7-interacting protein 1 n=1 Tax=Galendromus occidentalis TaxID=34638 RepID=A0AAJ7P9Q1_9ACAR|nr:activating transcription factor 7-interacting protein 1 [Galendromus occidentalis]
MQRARHPAPLPEPPKYDIGELHTPPAPIVDVTTSDGGIVVTWDMKLQPNLRYSPADKYQIFTYTEGEQPPSTDLWRNIGTINALPLPMAVTLCSYKRGFRYYFAVRGLDRENRYGAFNEPKSVDLREITVL